MALLAVILESFIVKGAELFVPSLPNYIRHRV
jgi:hypothetical protein